MTRHHRQSVRTANPPSRSALRRIALFAAIFVGLGLTSKASASELWDERFTLSRDFYYGPSQYFGISVGLSGNTAVVGAYGSGSAYLFDATTGNQSFQIYPSDSLGQGFFSQSVAIDGNRALVGDWSNDGKGGAFVYDATNGESQWKLTASDGVFNDSFANTVGISGNVAIAGAQQHNNGAGDSSGAAYLYDVSTGTQLHKLIPLDSEAFDSFGWSVAVSGNIAVVGSVADDSGTGFYLTGSAYLFNVATGQQLSKITAPDEVGGNNFGSSVAIDGSRLIIGATGDDIFGINTGGHGSAYVYNISNPMAPAYQRKLTASDGSNGDQFGYSVSLSGNKAIIGAPFDDDSGSSSGSAYIFDVDTGQQVSKLIASNGAPNDQFGYSVAISGEKAIVGAWSNDIPDTDSGAVYEFEPQTQWIGTSGGLWSQAAKWSTGSVPNGANAHVRFGNSITAPGTATVTLDVDVTASKIVFDNSAHSYLLSGAMHDLTLALSPQPPEIEVISGVHTIGATIRGTGGLTKTGPGTLIITGEKAYTGAQTYFWGGALPPVTYESSTFVSDGTLEVQTQPIPAGAVSINPTATLRLKQFVNYYVPAASLWYGSGNVIMEHTFSDTQLYIAPSATVRGSLHITATEVVNSGRLAPGFPGFQPASITTINGDFIQENDGTLEIEVGGLTPGTQHDQLVVNGNASLGGRLEVPIINGFMPAVNNQITILTTSTGHDVSGEFSSLFSPNLSAVNPNLAIQLFYNSTNVTLKFVTPSTAVQYVAPGTTANWHTASTWTAGNVPGTTNIINVQNLTASPRLIDIQDNHAFTDKISISGTQTTMTVAVHGGLNLSATKTATIGNRGAVELDGGNLVSGTVDVQAGGSLFGNGTVVGSLMVGTTAGRETATLSPGIPIDNPIQHLDVVGDYQQGPGGTLVIELTGADEGAFDTIGVSGQLKPGGTLRVDATSLASLTPGTMFHIITAGSLADDAVFAHVLTVGKNNIFFAPFYADPGAGGGAAGGSGSVTQGGVFLGGFLKGDMNMDGDVNGDDTAAFALALRDPDAYFNTRWPSGAAFIDGASAGSLDGYATDPINFVPNDRLDFDDINDFAALLAAGTGASTASIVAAIDTQLRVPEPASFILLLANGCFLIVVHWSRFGQSTRIFHSAKK